ncbi:hypothetical protein ABBQ32_012824 [Trebouxia sp. C0010 RCD-2024]
MAGAVEPSSHEAEQAASASMSLPWWVRYARWKPTSAAERARAERNLLAVTKAELEVHDTVIGPGKQDYMHGIVGGAAAAPPLVCLPGYGAGAAFFFRNFPSLCQYFRTYAVDPLGTGMSGRPAFTAKDRLSAENFFITALDKWREQMGLEKVVLMGHSMGGYLAATYALQHPERVQHLVLVCPAGITKQSEDYREPEMVRDPWSWRGQLYRLAKTCWNWGVTPGGVIRTLGPWGRTWISGYARNRFKEGMALSEEEVAAFEDYFYHITAARGSGEHALRHILKPFAWAHNPLEPQLQHLKVPVTFIYGESDWMDPKGGARVCKEIREERGQLTPADLLVTSIPHAGHYPFLDQPELFMKALLEQTKPYRSKSLADAETLTKPAGGGVDVVASTGDGQKPT